MQMTASPVDGAAAIGTREPAKLAQASLKLRRTHPSLQGAASAAIRHTTHVIGLCADFNQFETLGMTRGGDGSDARPLRRHNSNGRPQSSCSLALCSIPLCRAGSQRARQRSTTRAARGCRHGLGSPRSSCQTPPAGRCPPPPSAPLRSPSSALPDAPSRRMPQGVTHNKLASGVWPVLWARRMPSPKTWAPGKPGKCAQMYTRARVCGIPQASASTLS